MSITGAQIRAARAFLDWTMARLKKESGVGISTIAEIEKIDGIPLIASEVKWRVDARTDAIKKIVVAFEGAGITFLPGTAAGVGLRGKIKSEQ